MPLLINSGTLNYRTPLVHHWMGLEMEPMTTWPGPRDMGWQIEIRRWYQCKHIRQKYGKYKYADDISGNIGCKPWPGARRTSVQYKWTQMNWNLLDSWIAKLFLKWGSETSCKYTPLPLNLLVHGNRRGEMGPRFIVIPGKRGGARRMRAWSRHMGRCFAENLCMRSWRATANEYLLV